MGFQVLKLNLIIQSNMCAWDLVRRVGETKNKMTLTEMERGNTTHFLSAHTAHNTVHTGFYL